MYAFQDQGGDELALRPEGTAPVMRAYLEHGMSRLPQPVKLFYLERMYRRESPQRGRLREHHQFGCEAIGTEDAYVDVEMLALLWQFYGRLGLSGLSLQINNIGDRACRPRYVEVLREHLLRHESELAPIDRERLARNPLRVLDTKEPQSRPIADAAPSVLDFLCDDCRAHWEKLRAGLDALGIGYELNHSLIRGLDYYTRTVFEFLSPYEGAQAAIGGGGRYDGLAEAIGAPHTPGIGFGSGIERLILTMKDQGVEVPPAPGPRVFVAHVGAGTEDAALTLATRLRQQGVAAVMSFGQRSFKAQMRAADSSGATYAVIVGEDELREGKVGLRNLASGEQRSVLPDEVAEMVGAGG
jgi:histidyl-tRNA synthetase